MKFNWQETPEGFLKWVFVNLVTFGRLDRDLWDKLADATDQWTNIELTVQINGHEVPTDKLIEALEHNTTYHAEKAAVELVTGSEELSKLSHTMDELTDMLNEMQSEIKLRAERALRDLGMDHWDVD